MRDVLPFSRRPLSIRHRSKRPQLEALEDRTLLAAGVLDLSFGTSGMGRFGFNGSLQDQAQASATQSDNKLIVVGKAGAGETGTDFSLARYNLDGSLDTTFGIGGRVTTDFQGREDQVSAVAIGADGKIVLVGASSIMTTDPRFNSSMLALARYNSDGSLDTTFGNGGKVLEVGSSQSNPSAYLSSVVIQPDNKIVAAGGVTNTFTDGDDNSSTTALVARFNVNGTRDLSFGSSGIVTTGTNLSPVNNVALVSQSDGKLVSARTDGTLVRLNPNGSPDGTFGQGGFADLGIGAVVTSLALQANGQLVVYGESISIQVSESLILARANTNGTLDTAFGSSGVVRTTISFNDDANSVVIQADGKIIAGASGFVQGTGPVFGMARFNSDGSLDSSFGSGGKVTRSVGPDSTAYGLALQTGKAVQVGVTESSGNQDYAIARYTTSGSPDATFGSNGLVVTGFQGPTSDIAAKIAVQADGKIVEVGTVSGNSQGDFGIVRFSANGIIDTTFGTNGQVTTDFAGGSDGARDVLIQPDGKIVVVGLANIALNTMSGDYALARYNPNGSLDASFGIGGKVITQSSTTNSSRISAALQVDPVTGAVKILVDGTALLRYSVDGSLDPTFGTAGQAVHLLPFGYDIAVQPDGKIVEGGVDQGPIFEAGFDKGELFAVARYTANGLADPTFGSNGVVQVPAPAPHQRPSPSAAFGVVIQPDGKIVATGLFTPFNLFGPLNSLALARINTNGSLDSTFGVGGIADTIPATGLAGRAVSLQSDGGIVIVSALGTLLRFNPDGTADATFGNRRQSELAASFKNVDVIVQESNILTAATDNNSQSDFVVARFSELTSTNETYVAQLYVDLFHRLADPAGLAFWASRLDQGTSRISLTTSFTQSTEYRTSLAFRFYDSFLHRTPDPQGLIAVVAMFTNGATVEQVKAQFLGSAEYFEARALSDNNRFLDELYMDVFGRTVDSSGRQTFSQALAAGVSRSAVALAVLSSQEAHENLIGAVYVEFLHRSPDSGGFIEYTGALRNGVRSEAVIATIVASDEYFRLV